ncbi:MAG: phosphoethanolamine transferase CptA [Coriobacteriales bacterium]|jgi:hypothetical protein|nr:phosphoethanolamine transferase CptA [Coriobacteriales bacterium]
MGGRSVFPHVQSNVFPANYPQIKHIFSEREGHVPDNASNRELILTTANDNKNYRGSKPNGNRWYVKDIGDNKQVWVEVRQGIVQNAGVNAPPRTDWTFLEAKS